ncbi:hypothetical protein LQZ18_04075 [Lachnospiraceae bacterium ZAX-1]
MEFKAAKPIDLQKLLERGKTDAEKYSICFEGDLTQGKGAGYHFAGGYVVGADYITVRILKKPPFVSRARIEKGIRNYMNRE